MENYKIENMYDLNETIAADIFKGVTYPWEVLPKIKDFIFELGNTLPEDDYVYQAQFDQGSDVIRIGSEKFGRKVVKE